MFVLLDEVQFAAELVTESTRSVHQSDRLIERLHHLLDSVHRRSWSSYTGKLLFSPMSTDEIGDLVTERVSDRNPLRRELSVAELIQNHGFPNIAPGISKAISTALVGRELAEEHRSSWNFRLNHSWPEFQEKAVRLNKQYDACLKDSLRRRDSLERTLREDNER